MSDDDDKSDKGDAKAAKGKSNLVPAIVLAVGLAVGGYFMGGSSDSTTAAADANAPAADAPVPGLIATMDPLSVNLADGHFLKVGVALVLAEGIEPAEFSKGEIAKAKDMLIDRLGGAKMDSLTSPEGRKALKEELTNKAKEIYTDPETKQPTVLEVYFTDFVMQ